jgi:hypothetical protein
MPLRGEATIPLAVDIRMIDRRIPLSHHFFQVPVAQRISQVPTDTGQDDVFFDTVAFEVDIVAPSRFW